MTVTVGLVSTFLNLICYVLPIFGVTFILVKKKVLKWQYSDGNSYYCHLREYSGVFLPIMGKCIINVGI